MEHFMYLLKGYGFPLLLMGAICVVLVGIVKTIGLFKKMGKGSRTITLFLIDVAYSAAAILIYSKIANKEVTIQFYLASVSTLDACILSMYSVYEALGIKKFVQCILNLIANSIEEYASKKKDLKEQKQLETIAQTAQMVAKLLERNESIENETIETINDNSRL